MCRQIIPFTLLWLLSPVALAEDWPQWRGPSLNGIAAGRNYPTKWSDTENVAWKVALPGWGTSTPAVWRDKIIVTCQQEGKNAVMGLDRSGKTLWTTLFGEESTARNRKASGSNPSPVTDGQWVFVYFKSGDFACLDLQGQTVWSKNLQKEYGEDTLWWDLGTSPVLTNDFVVVACMQSGPSYVAAFEKATGKLAWKVDRQLEAPSESAQSYTTPLVVSGENSDEIIVLGADHVTSHNAKTGQELWRVGGLNPGRRRNYRSIASPVLVDGLLLAPYARGGSLTAIRLGGQGDVTDSHVAWVTEEFSADVPTPTGMDGRIYVCGDRGDVACLKADTGAEVWSEQLPRSRYPFSASPVIADGNLYLTREDGMTFVVQAGDQYQLLESNGIYEWTLATPVFIDGQILVRTTEHLYCIGKK